MSDNDKMYGLQMKIYNTLGEKLTYCGDEISTMDNDQLKKHIYFFHNHFLKFNVYNKGWSDIFEDVLIKRRINKINKIKYNIKS